MKLVKFEKNNCPTCVAVSNYLNDKRVIYETINVEKDPSKFIPLGYMKVPVVALYDDSGNVVKTSLGFNPDELEEMISKLQ